MRTARVCDSGRRCVRRATFPSLVILTLLALISAGLSFTPFSDPVQAQGPIDTAAVAAAPLSADAAWSQVHQAPAGQYFYGMTFVDRNTGYAISGPDWNNDQNGSGAPAYIAKTTDGGKTWTSKAISTKTYGLSDGWARGITCTDADNCWVAGKLKGRILRTTDGGDTWNPMTNQSGYPNWLWSAGNTGQGTTILAGTTCYDPADSAAVANWLRSTDGQAFRGVAGQPGVYNCFVQWDIECPAAGYCYSVGKDYTWRSTDNGATWTKLSAGVGRWYGGSCTSTTNCWIAGKTPFIKSTTNSGGGWTSNTVTGAGSSALLWDIAMVDNSHGYAVGCSNAESGTDRCLGTGIIYRTDDGKTWSQVTAPTSADIMDLWVFGMDDFFIVDWSGRIFHYGAGSGGPTYTPGPTSTPTRTPAVTSTATATPTRTPTRAATSTFTPTRTATATPPATPSRTPSPTYTTAPTSTRTATVTPSNTPAPTSTRTATTTRTAAPTSTATATLTAAPSDTPSRTPEPTVTTSPTVNPVPRPTEVGSFPIRLYLPILGD